jgi:hypothetical protein
LTVSLFASVVQEIHIVYADPPSEQILNPSFEDYTYNFSEPVFENWTQLNVNADTTSSHSGNVSAWGYSMRAETTQDFASPINGSSIITFGFWARFGGYSGDLYFHSINLWDTHNVKYSKSGILMHNASWNYYDCMDLINSSLNYIRVSLVHHNSYFYAGWDDVTLIGSPVVANLNVVSSPEINADFEVNGSVQSTPYNEWVDSESVNLTVVDTTKIVGSTSYNFESWTYPKTVPVESDNVVTNPSFETPITYSEIIVNGGWETGNWTGWTGEYVDIEPTYALNGTYGSHPWASGGYIRQDFESVRVSLIRSLTVWVYTVNESYLHFSCNLDGWDIWMDAVGSWVQLDLLYYLQSYIGSNLTEIEFSNSDGYSYLDDVSLMILDGESGWMFNRGVSSSYITRNPNAYSVNINNFSASFYIDSFNVGYGGSMMFFYVGDISYISPSAFLLENESGLYVEVTIGQYPEYDVFTEITYDSWHNITFLTRTGYYATEFEVQLDGASLIYSSENDVYGTYASFFVGAEDVGGQTYHLFFDDVSWTNMVSGNHTDDFESGFPTDWDVYGSCNLSSSQYVSSSHSLEMLSSNDTWMTEDRAHEGTHSAVLDYGGSSVRQILNASVPVTDITELSFWYYVNSSDALQYGGFQVVYDDDSGNYFDLGSLPNASIGSWTQEDVHTSLDPARNVTTLICWNDNEVSSNVYFDDVVLKYANAYGEGNVTDTNLTIIVNLADLNLYSGTVTMNYNDNMTMAFSAFPAINPEVTVNGSIYPVPYSLFTSSGNYTMNATSSKMVSGVFYTFVGWFINGSTVDYSPVLTVSVLSDTTFELYYEGFTSCSGLIYYFRSDTHIVNNVTAYQLDTVNTLSRLNSTETSGITGLNASWGFRVFLLHSDSSLSELTSGVQVAQMTRLFNGEGYLQGIWTCPQTFLVIGFDSILVRVYNKLDGGSWSLEGSWTTPLLVKKTLVSSAWLFDCYVALSSGSTNATFSFGDSYLADSLIAGIEFTDPNEFELMMYNLNAGNFFTFIMFPFTYLIGALFYGLLLLLLIVPVYIKYHSLDVVLFMLIIFGGAGGFFSLLMPISGLQIGFFVMAFAIGTLLYKVVTSR